MESYWYGDCSDVSISRCIGISRCNNDEWCWCKVAILAGAAAMLVIAAALLVLGYAIQEIATGFGMLGDMGEQLVALVMIAPGLLALAGVFAC